MPRGFYGRVGFDVVETITDGLEKLSLRMHKVSVNAVVAAAEPIAQRAYELANVSPGVLGHGVNGEHMRDEIKITVEDDGVVISAKIGIDMSIIPYAAHQEFGDRGKPFLRPAIDEGREFAHVYLQKAISEGLGEDVDVKSLVRFRRYA